MNFNKIWMNEDKCIVDIESVNDEYLFNICYTLSRGGGWKFFVTPDIINDVFGEAYKRHIARLDVLFNFELLAYYFKGYSTYLPRYHFTKECKLIIDREV